MIIKPHWFKLAEREIGIKEVQGPLHNDRILEYLGTVKGNFMQDEISWCAAFVNWCLWKNGITGTLKANARSYLRWGEVVGLDDIQIGDIVIFWRESKTSWKGHVGFYAGTRWGFIKILGGNQSNKVGINLYRKSKILGIRRPWKEMKKKT